MGNWYFGLDRETGEPISPDRTEWDRFRSVVANYFNIPRENIWGSTGFENFTKTVGDIYLRCETHGTSAYGQTNRRLLYSEINSETQSLIEAINNSYIEQSSERIALYMWDDSRIDYDNIIYISYDDNGNIDGASQILSYQPRYIGFGRTNLSPYGYYIEPNTSDADIYHTMKFDVYGNVPGQITTSFAYDKDTSEHDKVICNIPLFAQKSKAEEYIQNGWNNELQRFCLNSQSLAPEEMDEPTKTYYYNMNLIHNGTSEAKRSFRVDIIDGRIGAYKIEGNEPWNIGFVANSSKVVKVIYQDEETGTTEFESWDAFISAHGTEEWSYIEYTIGSGTNYYQTNVATNISLWKDEESANKYLNKQLSIEDSLSQGKDLSTIKIRTGQELNKTDNNSVGVGGSNRAFKLSDLLLNGITGQLWTDDTDVWSRILDGTNITNNPIDLIVNCLKFPFDFSQYCGMGSSSEIILGGLDTGTSAPSVTGLKTTQIASEFIKPIFNNFLDYSNVNVFLYLPFYGITTIDFKMIIDTVLSIDVVVDPFNGSMKYYIKSDGKLIEEYGTTVGMSVPMIGSDEASKSREIVQSSTDILSNVSGSMDSVQNALGASINITNMMNQIQSEPVMISKGNNSPGVGMCDVDYCFLIFDVQEAIQPSQLYSRYGYPCNRVVQLSNCSGYCEVNDIQLTGEMLDDERNEIISIVQSGVII